MPDPNSSDAERLARDLGNDAFARNVKSQRPPIADLMHETAELESSGAFMSGEDAQFEGERGPAPPAEEKRVQGEEHILQYFTYEHLPAKLQEVSRPFGLLAQNVVDTLPRNPERTVTLRKLLEAKDAAVRAAIAK